MSGWCNRLAAGAASQPGGAWPLSAMDAATRMIFEAATLDREKVMMAVILPFTFVLE